MTLLSAVLVVIALVPLPASILLAAQMLASLKRRPDRLQSRTGTGTGAACPAFTVVVPAHDEATVIAATIRSLRAQLRSDDRLLVVADNCTDDTAAIARSEGAMVTERFDAERRGKGYALEWGVRHDLARATAVTIVVDADCLVSPGGLEALAREAAVSGRPVQGDYLLEAPAGAGPGTRFSAFAIRIKNRARLLGSQRLGIPCVLTGSGMAFPRAVLDDIHLGSGEIVEDLLMSVDLALAGAPARFCPDARITSPLPLDRAAADGQRARWERGYLSVARRFAWRLVAAGVRRRSPRLIAMGIDIAIPPLSLFAVALMGLVVVTLAGMLFGASPAGFIIAAIQLAVFLITVTTGWLVYGRDLLNFGDFIALPLKIFAKIPFYVRLVRRPQQGWVRTARDSEDREP